MNRLSSPITVDTFLPKGLLSVGVAAGTAGATAGLTGAADGVCLLNNFAAGVAAAGVAAAGTAVSAVPFVELAVLTKVPFLNTLSFKSVYDK